MTCSRCPAFCAWSETVGLVIAVAVAASCGEGTGQEPALAVDTTGVDVVFSDPLGSDARCSLSAEPVLSLGTGQGDAPYRFEGVRGVARLSDGSIAVMNNHVYAHFRDGSRIRRLATLNGPRYGEWRGAAAALPTLFDPVPRVDARGTTIAITTAFDPEVLVLDDSLRPRHIVRWSDPEREVASAHVQAYRDIFIESAGGRGSENWSRFHEDAVSDQRPVANVFPTVSSLRVGRDGRLWVARYRRPGERWAWMVFGPAGDFICWCPQLPVTPYEFGSDYVLGTRTDDGVERVMMYEWHLPDGDNSSQGGEL